MCEIASQCDATAAPTKRREAAYFQKKIAVFLAELGRFMPIVNFKARDHGVLRQRRRIEQPGVGDYLLKLDEIFFAKLAPPKFAQRLHPKKCEPHFFLEIRFDRRSDCDATFCISSQEIVDLRNVWQIEQLEETINCAPVLGLIVFRCNYSPFTITMSILQSRDDPFHLRSIRGCFLRNDDIAAIRQNGLKSVEHSIRAIDDFIVEMRVGLIEPRS